MELTPKKADQAISYSEIDPQQANKLLHLQSNIMELVVLNYDHQLVLDKLCMLAEVLVPNAIASIMIFDEGGSKLFVKAAPSLHLSAKEALNGLEPGPKNGSCANAVFHNQPQFVYDTLTDKRWTNVVQFAHEFTVGACWSMPINLKKDEVFGSLALSSSEKRHPTEFQKRTLETAASIASIIFKRQNEEHQLWFLAHYDALTKLPNRTLLNLRLTHAIEQAFSAGEKLAIMFMDLDQFKEINDSLGHQAGDDILNQASKRLLSCKDNVDTLARMGGDEFILLIDRIQGSEIITQIAEKVVSEFARPFHLLGQDHLISISIGISIYPEHGTDGDRLLQNADTAMYQAKANKSGSYIFFRDEHKQQLDDRINLTAEFRKAVARQELFLNYQPQLNYSDDKINAVEVLLRWRHPSKGLISPIEFIPIAEQTGLIKEIGLWVISTACKQCLDWWTSGLPRFLLAVNVSIKQLQPGFADQIQDILQSIEFPLHCLELEITESLFMENSNELIQELNALKKMGIAIAMDDFGTGHSSLAQLKHLPISKLKIDRSFVKGIPEDHNDKIIAQTIISMAHTLGLEVVAEGVESEAQRLFLTQEGCDLLQGFLFSQPLLCNEFEQLLKAIITE